MDKTKASRGDTVVDVDFYSRNNYHARLKLEHSKSVDCSNTNGKTNAKGKKRTTSTWHPTGNKISPLGLFRQKRRRKRTNLPIPVQRKGRLIGKTGTYCVKETNIPQQKLQYIKDLYTTLIEAPWYYMCVLFTVSYLFCYVFFTTGYYLCAYVHGDLKDNENNSTYNGNACIVEGNSFLTIFLFSFETQHTIGYGFRFVTQHCAVTIVLVIMQVWSGILIQSFLVAIVISKLTRPKKRAETLIFSNTAVISVRDGRLCFMIRVGDMRRTHLIDARIRLLLIRSYETKESEFVPFHQFDMSVGFQRHEQDSLFLAWPTIICHVMDEGSPLYDYTKDDMRMQDFEIIAILEGTVESTGQATQARTSYRPTEIFWGYRFETLLTYQSTNGEYIVNYARFHNCYPVDTPTSSARELHEEERIDRDTVDDVSTTPTPEMDLTDVYATINSVKSM